MCQYENWNIIITVIVKKIKRKFFFTIHEIVTHIEITIANAYKSQNMNNILIKYIILTF